MNHRVPGASLLALLLASPVSAQVTSDAQLRGTVRDATEAVVVTATVVVVSPQLIGGPRTVPVGPDGQWRAAALSPGTYTVSVSAPGFEPVVRAAGAHDIKTEGDTISVAVEGEAPIAPVVVKALVDAGAGIISVIPEERPLEEVYLRLLKDDDR